MSTTVVLELENNSAAAAPAEVQSENAAINNKWTALHVGDLDKNVTEEELKEVFVGQEGVVSVKICTNEALESLGYGYINLRTPEDAKKALEALNFTLVNGKPIRVAYSWHDPNSLISRAANLFVKNLDKSIEDQEFYNMFAEFGVVVSSKIRKDAYGVSKGFGYVQYEKEESASKAIKEMNGLCFAGKELYVGLFVSKEERQKDIDTAKFTNLYVKNLMESITEEDLRHHFGKFGKLNSVVVMRDQNGNSKEFGFVDFEKHEDATNAMKSLNGSLFHGEELYVARAQKKSEREAELKRAHERIVMSSQGLNNLYVKNLDDDVGDDKLKFMFSSFGTITSCKVILTTRGISKGFGFVAFSTAHEAAKAISEMNGKVVGRKPLYVAVAEKKEDRLTRYRAMFSNNLPHTIMPALPAPLPPNGQAPKLHMFTSQAQVPPAFFRPPVGLNSQGLRPYPPFSYMGQLPMFPMMFPHPQMLQQRPRHYPPYVMPNGHPHGNMLPLIRSSAKLDGVGTSTPAIESSTYERQVMGEKLFELVKEMEPERAPKITGMLLALGLTEVALLIDSPQFRQEKVEEAVQALKNSIDGEQSG